MSRNDRKWRYILISPQNNSAHKGWGWVKHICVNKSTIIGSDNGLSPGWRQAIIWTNAEILLNRPLGTNFSEIVIKIHTFSFKKMPLKMLSGKWRPFCISLNVLNLRHHVGSSSLCESIDYSLRLRQIDNYFADHIFKFNFLNEKFSIFIFILKFHGSLFPWVSQWID